MKKKDFIRIICFVLSLGMFNFAFTRNASAIE